MALSEPTTKQHPLSLSRLCGNVNVRRRHESNYQKQKQKQRGQAGWGNKTHTCEKDKEPNRSSPLHRLSWVKCVSPQAKLKREGEPQAQGEGRTFSSSSSSWDRYPLRYPIPHPPPGLLFCSLLCATRPASTWGATPPPLLLFSGPSLPFNPGAGEGSPTPSAWFFFGTALSSLHAIILSGCLPNVSRHEEDYG